MKFPPSFLDEIRARLPVSAVVGRRVKLKKQGREWRGLSPFNAEKTPSFYVNDQKGFYHCFSSGRHGDIFRFVMETEGLPFPEAVERLAGEAGVPMPVISREEERREEQRSTLYDVLEAAVSFFERTLQAREGAAARGYLADRGLTPATQAEFRLGFAQNERFALRDHLAGRGISREQMIEAGLLVHGEGIEVPYDRFRNRIMFPIADSRGRIIAFGGRAMEKDAPAKYLNSPETELFHKGRRLFNHHRARTAAHTKGTVIAVEGYVDAIMMSVGGFPHTVAPLGTALTDDQLQLLWRMSEEPILCFDGDKAGRRAAYRAIDVALAHLAPGRTLRFALLPDGQDPDDLIRRSGSQAMDDVLKSAMSLADLLWLRETEAGDISTPERRAALEKRFGEVLAVIQDETVRKHYRAAIGEKLRGLFAGSAARAGESWSRTRTGSAQREWSGDRRDRRPDQTATVVTAGVREGALVRGARSVLPSREALILATLIAHPFLLEARCEMLSAVEFEHPEAARLCAFLVDLAAQGVLTPADIRDQLTTYGFARMADRLGASTSALHWWVRTDAAAPDVERAFDHVVTLHTKMRTLHRELKLAQAQLERDLSEENFARLADIKAQIDGLQGAEATIEGFGASSGRPETAS
ncbi:MAG: DNA primase [Labrys sp. (in: a-proteobacteria)]